jgi:hypothetical protein
MQNDKVEIENDYYKYNYRVEYADAKFSLLTNYKTKKEFIPKNDFPQFIKDHGTMMGNLTYSLSYDKGLIQKRSNKWPGTFVSVVTLLLGACAIFLLYSRYNPQPYYPAAWALPIGGWLILVGIGITLTPFRLLYQFATQSYMISGESWLIMWYDKSYGYFFMLLLEHIYNLIYLLFSMLLVVLFFQRRSSVPLLASILYGGSCLAIIFDNILAVQMDPSTNMDANEIIKSIIAAAVWIPYFHMSLRVKKTFVNTNDGSDNDNLVREPVPVVSHSGQ